MPAVIPANDEFVMAAAVMGRAICTLLQQHTIDEQDAIQDFKTDTTDLHPGNVSDQILQFASSPLQILPCV